MGWCIFSIHWGIPVIVAMTEFELEDVIAEHAATLQQLVAFLAENPLRLAPSCHVACTQILNGAMMSSLQGKFGTTGSTPVDPGHLRMQLAGHLTSLVKERLPDEGVTCISKLRICIHTVMLSRKWSSEESNRCKRRTSCCNPG